MPSSIEREIKLRFESAASARDAVVAVGASPLRGRRLQEDALLDRPDGTLRRAQSVLRIRTECGTSRVTFKGPPLSTLMKVREELETLVGDGEVLLEIFAALGYTPWFRYEKYREEFAAPDVTVAIDETPVGTFVELEGDDEGIHRMANALGRGPHDYIVESYRALFHREQTRLGLPAGDMLFDVPDTPTFR